MTESDKCEYTFYTFICNDPNITDCYVGSTKAFRQRKNKHKSDCNLETCKSYNLKIYQTIRANGGWNNWEMKPIDTKICSKLDSRIHETKLMEERHATLNCIKAYISEEQKKEENNERNKYDPEKYQQNRNKILEQRKNYKQKNKDKINARKRELYALKKQQKELINMIKDDLTANSDESYSHQLHTEHT